MKKGGEGCAHDSPTNEDGINNLGHSPILFPAVRLFFVPQPVPRPTVIVVIGAVAGFLAGLFGIGGGIVMVPLLILWAGLPQRVASATSLVAIIPTATIGAVSYLASGTVPVDQIGFGVLVAIGAAVVAPLGARALRTWNVGLVRWIFVGLLAVTAATVFVSVPVRGESLEWSVGTTIAALAIGGFMGFTAGLLGVGGGIIAVPLLIAIGSSDLIAKALSLVAMVPGAISGSRGSIRAGLIDTRAALWLGLSTTLTAPLGVLASIALPVEWANPLLSALILIAASQLAWRGWRERQSN